MSNSVPPSGSLTANKRTSFLVKRARGLGCSQHKVGPDIAVTGLSITDHTFTLPLDYSGASAYF